MPAKKKAEVTRQRAVASKGGRKTQDENAKERKAKPTAPLKIPKSLNACVDLYDKIREERLALAKEVSALGEKESELREHLINKINKSDGAGVVGTRKRAIVVTDPVPVIEDEKKFGAFARRKGNEDLLVQKPNMKAIEERWEAGKKVPGVGTFNVVKLSLKKI